MNAPNVYQSFNREKSIDEMQYGFLDYKKRLQDLEEELTFLKGIIDAAIFKPKVMNLFESLALFKKDINLLDKTRLLLLNKVNSQLNQINQKFECQDLACDNYFIKAHDDLEREIYEFLLKITDFKSRLFRYVQSVIHV